MKIQYLIICMFLVFGCDFQRRDIKQAITHWMGKKIVFSDSLQCKIYGKDTSAYLLNEHKYKIFHYVDTNGCSECQLKFYDWRRLQRQIDSLHADISIVFVVFAKHYVPIEVSQRLNKFGIPIFYDTSGKMGRMNDFSFNPKYKTFLLDSSNHVVGVGNPALNPQIWAFYQKIVQSSSSSTCP